jgi:hypothetical protein
MGGEQFGLLDELSGGQLYSSAILSTYGFDGTFFEADVLPVLSQLEVANTVVLTDTESYRRTDAVTQAGQSYYLDHVRCPQIHHPKFVALFGRDYGRLFVGSANLTKPGWQQSAELMTVIEYPGEPEGPDTKPVFAQLREFIEHSQARIRSSRASEAVDDAFDDAPWLPEAPAGNSGSDVQLLHNYETPLLPQVREHIGERPIETVEICSPFFSGGNTEPLEDLCELDPDRITVNIQPDKVEGFNADVFDTPAVADIDVTVNEIALTGDDADRYIHAKLLVLSGPDGSWAFYGSPNFTKTALLQTGDVGNVELGVLRYDSDPEHFAYLLDDEAVTREVIAPESIEYHPPTTYESSMDEVDIQLTDAYLESGGALIVEYETTDTDTAPEQATITLRHSTEDTTLDIDEPTVDAGSIQSDDDRISEFCEQAAQVRVSVHRGGEVLRSDARWISFPSLQQTPRPSEIQAIERSEGRDGLIDVLDRLPTWGLICKFLKNVDLRNATVSNTGRRITSNSPKAGEAGGMEEWSPLNREELFERKVQTLSSRFEQTHKKLLVGPADPETFESFVNQYVTLSKLVLWWESQDLSSFSHLAKIRVATETVGEFISGLHTNPDARAAAALEYEHALFEHTAVSVRYVEALQRRAGYDTGVNENVYRVFRNTNRDVLRAFAELRGEPTPDDRLSEIIEEYDAIDAVAVSRGQVVQYCSEFVESTE